MKTNTLPASESQRSMSKALKALRLVYGEPVWYEPACNREEGYVSLRIPGISQYDDHRDIAVVCVYFDRDENLTRVVVHNRLSEADEILAIPVKTIFGGMFPALEAIEKAGEAFRTVLRLRSRGWAAKVSRLSIEHFVDDRFYKVRGHERGGSILFSEDFSREKALHGIVTLAFGTFRPRSVSILNPFLEGTDGAVYYSKTYTGIDVFACVKEAFGKFETVVRQKAVQNVKSKTRLVQRLTARKKVTKR